MRWEHEGTRHERDLPADASVRTALDRELSAAPPPVELRVDGLEGDVARRIFASLAERLAEERPRVAVRWVPAAPLFSCLLDDGGYGRLHGGLVGFVGLLMFVALVLSDWRERRRAVSAARPHR